MNAQPLAKAGLARMLDPSYRAAVAAVAISAALHGAMVVGIRVPAQDDADLDAPEYTANLQPAAVVEAPAPAVAVPTPQPRPRRARPVLLPDEAVAYLPDLPVAAEEPLAALEPIPFEPAPAVPQPKVVALAQPSVPIAPPPPVFPSDALPAEVSIAYSLTSAFADGEAEYSWKREGDRYEISGSIRATGFFAVFLEGHIDQEATGRVTPEGLRPSRFSERRPGTALEGLEFDWDAGTVEFQRGDQRRTGALTGTTVDWLSMIFQLAHMPPKGDAMDLRVYTQRRLYQYRLQILGVEELELPLGRTNALHLRHTGARPEETVDVWLGLEHHYLPVKLRYPVARNRLVIEQSATRVRAR